MASQKFIGQCWFESSDNPTPIILDPSNGQITSTVAEINLLEAGELIGLNGGALLLGSDAQFIDSNLILNQGGNLAGISFDGTDLFINAPNVVIANFDTSNLNVNVNLDGINNQLNNLSNDINFIELNVGNLQNDLGNVSNLVGDAYNQANFAYNQANSAFNGANSAFNVANSSFNQANSAYNQANSATILAGNAYNQANSYLNSLNTNQIIVNSADLLFGVNMSVSPQVRLQSNSSTAPALRLYQNDGIDEKEVFIGSADLTITHNYTSISDPESVPFVLFSEPANSVGVSLHAGSVVPNFIAPGGSLYLQTTGDFFTSDGVNWTSQSLGSTVRTKHIIVRDNGNSNVIVNIDPANLSGIYLNCDGGSENPSITLDKFNSTLDSIAVLDDNKLTITHAFATEDQTQPYIQLFDSASTALINTAVYFGDTIPNHSAPNGSLFIQGGSAPNLYQYNGTAWGGVGGGGGGVVGSYSVPCISKSTTPTGLTLSTTPQIVLFDTDVINTPASWIGSPVSGVWTVPFSGVYTLSASLSITGTGTNSARAVWYINGSATGSRDIEIVQTGDNWLFIQYTTQLNVGDTVDLRMSSNTNTPTATFNATGSYATWQAYRLDPLTISSTIYIPKLSKWRGSANYSLSPIGIPNQILFGNPDILIPSASWVNATTGQMEVLESGVYYVFASLRFATEAVEKTVNARIYVNGSQVGRDVEYFNVSFPNPIITVSGVFSLNANDIITIWADTIQASGGSIVNGTDESTYYYVEKISV